MVVEKEFYKRLRLLWWVFLGMQVYSFLESVLIKIAYNVLNDYLYRGVEPSEAKVRFVRFVAEHGSVFSYIGIAITLIYFVTMLLLRKYSKGLLITAVIGIIVTGLSLFNQVSYRYEYIDSPKVLFVMYAFILGSLVIEVLFALSMMKLVKPFSKDITTLWMIYLMAVTADYVLRIMNAGLTILVSNGREKAETFLDLVSVIQNIYGYLMIPFEIICFLLTLLMFKKKLCKENTKETGELTWQN